MLLSERHKTNNLQLVTILLYCCCIVAGKANSLPADEVFEVLPQTAAVAAAAATTTTTTLNGKHHQDEVNVLTFVTPNATIAATRLDPNNNNEWRPLGHGDPLQKDPTYDYSPPALERVRYWAESNTTNTSKDQEQVIRQKLPAEILRNKTKSEILLLGVASERGASRLQMQAKQPSYGTMQQQHQQQVKYAPIRRSYYAPQQLQQQQQQQMHMPHTHLMPPPMMNMKGPGMAHVEYRHNVMNSPSSSSFMSMNMGSSYSAAAAPNKPVSSTHYYSSHSTASPGWYSHTPSMSSVSGMSSMSGMPLHRLSFGDAHYQESMQHYSFSRPQQTVSYSPNAIHMSNKQMPAVPRKPWLHELLQKELVKPTTMKQRMKPTMPATKYLMGTTKPQMMMSSGSSNSGSSFSSTFTPLTYAPVTFVPGPPTIATPTTTTVRSELYITPTTPIGMSGFRPMLVTSGSSSNPSTSSSSRPSSTSSISTTTSLPIYQRPDEAATSTTSNRLMIPQTNNLARRPTVAPAPELTTDALFSHYKQPQKPLLGPMYLIIEGHSKVKTYGQNELDPHSPKIVPVISKREPVVRIADPNEQRGTVETYQVKHLHTKTTPLMSTTTTTTPATTTTKRPTTTTTTTTMRPTTTTTMMKTTLPSGSPSTPKAPQPTSSTLSPSPLPPANGVQDLLSLLDNMFSDAHDMASTPGDEPAPLQPMSTVLKPVTMKPQSQSQAPSPEPRIGSQAGSIESLLDASEEQKVKMGAEIATSTEPEQPYRATRQIFDYDQLPETRLKDAQTDDSDYEMNDDEDDNDDDDEENDEIADELLEQGEFENAATESMGNEFKNREHNLLKRIDTFIDNVDDEDDDDDLDDLLDEQRQHKH